ncbi:MAG: hypothetical protein ACP5NX_00940 [Candidatus Bilamarchaeaceae archaeon]
MMKTVESKPVSLEQVQEILEKRAKDSELEYEQSETLEYTKAFAKKGASKNAKEIRKACGKIDEETALKIADIAPKHPETLKAVLAKDKIMLTEEELASVLKLFE